MVLVCNSLDGRKIVGNVEVILSVGILCTRTNEERRPFMSRR